MCNVQPGAVNRETQLLLDHDQLVVCDMTNYVCYVKPHRLSASCCRWYPIIAKQWVAQRVEHLLQAILPARAATEGMAGASRASANTRLYVRPKVVFPKRETMPYAIRLPRPDLMKPPDSQKAMAINHLSTAKSRDIRQIVGSIRGDKSPCLR